MLSRPALTATTDTIRIIIDPQKQSSVCIRTSDIGCDLRRYRLTHPQPPCGGRDVYKYISVLIGCCLKLSSAFDNINLPLEPFDLLAQRLLRSQS
jgi:hypothetical protein